MIVGCAASQPTQPADRPPAAAVDNTIRHREKLPAVTLDHAAVVDGRSLAVYTTAARDGDDVAWKNRWVGNSTPFYELRDADTGKVLRPLGFDQIRLVPGLGVMVLSGEDRFWAIDGTHARRWIFGALRGYRAAGGYFEFKPGVGY